jgi:hypothetical protein
VDGGAEAPNSGSARSNELELLAGQRLDALARRDGPAARDARRAGMNDTRDDITRLGELRLPELQARYAQVIGEPTRCPNKAWLIRKIGEAMTQAAESKAPASASTTVTPEAGAEATGPGRRLRDLSVAELQARHMELIGRPSGSSHVGYLRWRLRQAERGRVRVGPATREHREGEAADFKVLPFRMESAVVARLDAARTRLGLGSRTELLRRALHDYLSGAGEREVAELFLPDGAS